MMYLIYINTIECLIKFIRYVAIVLSTSIFVCYYITEPGDNRKREREREKREKKTLCERTLTHITINTRTNKQISS